MRQESTDCQSCSTAYVADIVVSSSACPGLPFALDAVITSDSDLDRF